MKKKLVNPHDSLFRQVWSDPENARGFLSAWLPGETVSVMNMDTLEICRDSYVSKSLRTYYSDILYKIRLADRPGYVYLLFEHKSEPDSMTPFQLLKYMVRIWEQYHRETGKKGRLPVIIPLVLYQGRAEWGIGDRFSSVVENSDSDIKMNSEIGEAFTEFRKFMFAEVYNHKDARREERKVDILILNMFGYYIKNVGVLPLLYQKIAENEGACRAVTDYIAGMTDNFALHEYDKIFIPKSWGGS